MKRSVCILVALAGCVSDASSISTDKSRSSGVSGRAYDNPWVAEHLNAFGAVCLIPDMSENSAEAAAKAAGVDVEFSSGWKSFSPKTRVKISGNSYDPALKRRNPDLLYNSYWCGVEFNGVWADQVLPDTQEMLTSAGFRTVSAFTRASYEPSQAYEGNEIVKREARLARGDRLYSLTIEQSPPGRQTTAQASIIYLSNTRISISTASTN